MGSALLHDNSISLSDELYAKQAFFVSLRCDRISQSSIPYIVEILNHSNCWSQNSLKPSVLTHPILCCPSSDPIISSSWNSIGTFRNTHMRVITFTQLQAENEIAVVIESYEQKKNVWLMILLSSMLYSYVCVCVYAIECAYMRLFILCTINSCEFIYAAVESVYKISPKVWFS